MSANTMRWTARDLTALTWIHDQRAVSYRQLAHLLGILGNGEPVGDRAVRRALERWEREGLIVRRSHTEVPSRVVWLTPKGQREIGVEEGPIRRAVDENHPARNRGGMGSPMGRKS